MGAKVGALWPFVFAEALKSQKYTSEINVVFLLCLAVSAEVHRDLCIGVLLRGAGGAHFLGCGHLGRG